MLWSPGYLLLTTPLTASEAATSCRNLGEALVPTSSASDAGLQSQINYLIFGRTYPSSQAYWVADGNAFTLNSGGSSFTVSRPSSSARFPALCTQRAPWQTTDTTNTSSQWQVTTQSNNVQYTGYRDALSFRFLAVPYANPVQRFAYSTPFDPSVAGSSLINALDTSRNKQCPQDNVNGAYSEQCLVTNIFTPYLPSASEASNSSALRPVVVFFHGGGYVSGTGLDNTFDGGNLASRSDVVVLTLNYRLGTLGFLAYNDQIRGNYAVGDVVTALQWVQKYIKAFGGDPSRVTIAGQSAGAQMVENILASPPATGLFHRAIILSGRGHGPEFVYPSIAAARQFRGNDVVNQVGCGTASDVLACLRSLPVTTLVKASVNFVNVDGNYIRYPRLDMRPPGSAQGHVNRVPVIWGLMRDELASLGIVPPSSETNLSNAMKTAQIGSNYSTIVLNNPSVFPVSSYGVQNLTVAVNTEIKYRCGIQSMAYASVVNGVFPSVWAYIFDRRSYQLPFYDPYNVCKPKSGSMSATTYYMCHSGDLIPFFHSVGMAFKLPYRDSNDLPWMAGVMDQFSAFIRTGNPTPSTAYLQARGKAYASSLARITGSGAWSQLTSSSLRTLSMSISQVMKPLAQRGDQCTALGKPTDYIAKM
uniref:Carboxylic ester hydrolase n=1 Tax=Kalmanozyma brasiliensis (strain GHG001) TaxID=1365824 RepID=V5GV50_KALBG